MLEGNPFADLVPSGTPGIIMGPPEVPKPQDPLDVEGKQLAIQLQRQRLEKGDPMGEGAAKLREGENTAAFLTTNLLTNVNLLNQALKTDPTAAAPTWGQLAAGMLGQDVKNAILPEQRQVVENAQRLIVDSALTLGTGAAYTAEQIEAYRRGYFPQVGDSEAAVKAKREALRGALMAAKIKAGNAAPQIDQAMEALGLSTDPLLANGGGTAVPEGEGVTGQRLTPEQEKEYAGFLRTKPDAAGINAWWAARGFPGGIREADEIAKALREGRAVDPGVNYSEVDAAAEAEAQRYRSELDKVARPDGAAQTLLTSGMSLNLSDEAAGVGTAVSKLVTGKNPLEGYKLGRDVERLRIADARQQLGYGGTALEIAGGFLSANPVGAIRPATSALATIAQGAKTGAGVGALAGYGAGEGFSDSLEKGAIGAALGGVLGGGISGISTRLGPRLPDDDLATAAASERVRISEPMFRDNRAAVNKAGRLEADPAAAPVIQEGFANTADDIATGVTKLAKDGASLNPQTGGDMVREAAKRIKEENSKATAAAYDAAQSIDGDPMVNMEAMRANLDAEIASLNRTPSVNADQIKFLQRVRRDIDKLVPLSAVRDLRSNLRDAISSNDLGRTRAERRVLSALEAGKKDIELALSPEARAAWQEADKLYAETMSFNKEALEPFVGKDFDKLNSEAIFQRIKSAVSPRGNGRALASLHRRLSPDESRDIATTFAEGLGRRGPGEDFSAALFISQARNLSQSARETVFGPSGAASFNNLLRLSRRLEQAKSQINTSKTARPVVNAIRQRANLIIGGLLTGGGAITGGPVGGGVGLAAAAGLVAATGATRALSAKALMNPRVSRWLLEGLDIQTAAQAKSAVNKLSNIIAREPAIAAELTPIQQALSSQIRPAMASDETDEEKPAR